MVFPLQSLDRGKLIVRMTPLSRSLTWMPLISRPFEKRKRLKTHPKSGPIEVFEDRVLLTAYSVDTNDDSGAGSLRQAILDANAHLGADTIEFNLDSDELVIQPLSSLPAITDPVTIDGATQPGFTLQPIVTISGALIPAETFAPGLEIDTSNSTIRSLVINGFADGEGILIGGFDSTGVTGNHVEGCYIGLSADGSTVIPNANGIRIANGAQNNVIGGTTAGQGNTISGNSTYGILLQGEGTSGNLIQGNIIGITEDPLTDVGNGYGISLAQGASNNTIGGTTAGARNLISGNIDYGIALVGNDVTGNVIQGNWIGLNGTGTAAYGSFTDVAGISLSNGAHGNTIGGTAAGAGNVIAGVTGNGITLQDEGTSNNVIQGNYLGVNASGTAAVGINDDAIFVIDATNNTIGGTVAGAGNVISGAGRHGITIFGASTSGNNVWGNLIGTNAAGTTAIPNGNDGIHFDGAPDNIVGGATLAKRNVISGNAQNGITVTGAGASDNIVQGNYIGVQIDGESALPNQIDGIQIADGAVGTLIGGSAVLSSGDDVFGEPNVIAFNAGRGVNVTGNATTGNTIFGNSIYLNDTYEIDLNSDLRTNNDGSDGDNGPNGRQNFPILSSANSSAGSLAIFGTLNSTPLKTFTIDFYSSTAVDANGFGQGEVYLGSTQVITSATGAAGYSKVFTASVSAGHVITATATDDNGSTSEFSSAVTVVGTPSSNPVLTLSTATVISDSRTTPVVLDATATLTDADSANFNGGKLTVTLTPAGKGSDQLAVRNQGTGAGQISVSNKDVLFEGVVIGTMTGGKGKKALVVTLIGNATVEATQALVRNITYLNKAKKVPVHTKTAQFEVTDGSGHSSGKINKLIEVVRGS